MPDALWLWMNAGSRDMVCQNDPFSACHDEVPIMIDHLGYVHRQSLADIIALRPFSDRGLSQ
jgi:hypothetical protein